MMMITKNKDSVRLPDVTVVSGSCTNITCRLQLVLMISEGSGPTSGVALIYSQ